MAKPCCFTLNESDGNSSVCSIPNDAAAKSSAGRAEALPLFESAWWHFQMSGPVGALLRWTEIEFFKFKRIYVEGDPTEIVISLAVLFAWPCVSKHTAMKTNFGTSGLCLSIGP